MGSLMAGWDSPVLNSKSAKYRKNLSLTKEEIEAYWKSKKKVEEEHLKAASSPFNGSQDSEGSGVSDRRSSSLPPANTREGFMNMMETETSSEKLVKKNGWWTASKWAFLNEPPVLERASNTYSSQFHVANFANSKGDTGIST